ncbi:MAG: chitinase [Methyloprofundus sp.]|nr:chitinase [Methyloprofundus sp.]
MMSKFTYKPLAFAIFATTITGYTSSAAAVPAQPTIAWMSDTVTTSTVNVHWDMWWGKNADHWKLLVNNEQQCTGTLIANGSEAQLGECDISLEDGAYQLVAEICNDSGCSQSAVKAITVSGGTEGGGDEGGGVVTPPIDLSAPAKPAIAWLAPSIELSNDAVNIDIKWNMWWGVNGDHWRLLQNETVIYDASVAYQATNDAQTAITQVNLDSVGSYAFQVELCHTVDAVEVCTPSDIATVAVVEADTVTEPPVDPEEPPVIGEWELGEYNQAYDNTTGSVVASYFVEWGVYGRDYHVANIPASNLTHVLYGFIAVCGDNASALDSARNAINAECANQADDTVTLVDRYATLEKSYPGDAWDDPIRGNFGQLIKMKQQNPDIKILPSIGGWTLSDPFFDIANDPARRATFVASAIAFIKQYDFFDGIDVDWEFPGGEGANPSKGSAADAQGFADLMADLRAALDVLETETGRPYELTAAMNVSAAKVNNVNYVAAAPYMDYFFAMSYDFYGAWADEIDHHTALYPTANDSNAGMNVSDGVDNLINAGVPANKIVVGAAMYGRGWKGNGAIDGTWEAGVLDYKDIEVNYLGGENGTGINGFVYQYDEVAEAPSLYRASTAEYITYDNPRSVKAKGEFVINRGLAGVFAWEIDADNGHILNAIHQGLGHSLRSVAE